MPQYAQAKKSYAAPGFRRADILHIVGHVSPDRARCQLSVELDLSTLTTESDNDRICRRCRVMLPPPKPSS